MKMRKQIIFAVILAISSIKSFSQIIFEEGYFIDELNQINNCLIKNIDWMYNPSEFEYKLYPEDSVHKANILNVKEFGVTGVSKYIRAKVNFDKSNDNINNLGTERNPIFEEELVFLKVIIEGKASLFKYENAKFARFFYKMSDSNINQLVYKRYLVNGDILQNNLFRQQLINELKCKGITSRNVENINYNKKELERIFLNYNKCEGSPYVNYEPKQKRDLFNLTIRPGLNLSNLEVNNSMLDPSNIDFENELNLRFGIEAELVLPFNKNKWSLIIEPTYQYFNSKKTTESRYVAGGILVFKVNYKSIEFPIGARHYFFINDKLNIFINAFYIFDLSNNSKILLIRNDGSIYKSLDVNSRTNIAFGLGSKYKNRYCLEMRYQTNREILGSYLSWNSDYSTFSLIFGYSLF